MQSTPLCFCVISHSPGPTFPACWAPCMGPFPLTFCHREAVFFSKSLLFTLFVFPRSGFAFSRVSPLHRPVVQAKDSTGSGRSRAAPIVCRAHLGWHSGHHNSREGTQLDDWHREDTSKCIQLSLFNKLFLVQLLTLKEAKQNATFTILNRGLFLWETAFLSP